MFFRTCTDCDSKLHDQIWFCLGSICSCILARWGGIVSNSPNLPPVPLPNVQAAGIGGGAAAEEITVETQYVAPQVTRSSLHWSGRQPARLLQMPQTLEGASSALWEGSPWCPGSKTPPWNQLLTSEAPCVIFRLCAEGRGVEDSCRGVIQVACYLFLCFPSFSTHLREAVLCLV